MSENDQSLDDLLLALDSLHISFKSCSGLGDLITLLSKCITLDKDFVAWQESRSPEFKPLRIGHITRHQEQSRRPSPGYWPGRVDTYFDLYVAGVWNVFRTARLTLLALIVRLSNILGSVDGYGDPVGASEIVANEIVASIPYHLTDNLQVFLSETETIMEITDPGKKLGGLLLLHPLFIASRMSFLPQTVREYMQSCLAWIGSNMGLGQAALLAQVRILWSLAFEPSEEMRG